MVGMSPIKLKNTMVMLNWLGKLERGDYVYESFIFYATIKIINKDDSFSYSFQRNHKKKL